MENAQNPYAAPEGELVSENDDAYGEVKFFSPSSRIGRLRYLSHVMLMMLGFIPALMIGAAAMAIAMPLGILLLAVVYIVFLVYTFIAAIQRLHDLNQSGWWVLAMFVPFANLALAVYLLFFPGTPGSNNYGLRPPPNKTWHWVLGLGIFGFSILLGILAAIAMPAYQGYLERARDAEMRLQQE